MLQHPEQFADFVEAKPPNEEVTTINFIRSELIHSLFEFRSHNSGLKMEIRMGKRKLIVHDLRDAIKGSCVFETLCEHLFHIGR